MKAAAKANSDATLVTKKTNNTRKPAPSRGTIREFPETFYNNTLISSQIKANRILKHI